ncbi:TorD/DmsD family molecular chaperone [Saccharibacillus alkalitolerans]|uniref:Molecular chaperone TorD family protein n=1 Tax=Saccharibacillus alkalitolerans TaxID=2705290 RepID=A0ABX0F6Y1_9BACL|nr:molecular chaperone TorD family protein [Saccharibacillus alkalitolerans]NGZ76190.1 molecular chaperone TorD family protein [Saccharibacillus alkalitolerans]
MTTATMEKNGSTARGDEQWAHTRMTLYQLLSDFIIYKPSVHLLMKWRRKLENAAWDNEAYSRFKAIIGEPGAASLPAFCAGESREYDVLVGRRQTAGIPLRESFYAGGEAETIACRASAEYDRAGVILNKTAGEKDDELSVELEFMAVLAERMTEGVRSRAEREQLARIQLGFLKRHLLPWVPSFCSEMRKHTESPLYLNLCGIMESLIVSDSEWLGARVED